MAVTKQLDKRKLIAVVEVPGDGDKVRHLDRAVSGVNHDIDDDLAYKITTALFGLQSAKVVSVAESTRSTLTENQAD